MPSASMIENPFAYTGNSLLLAIVVLFYISCAADNRVTFSPDLRSRPSSLPYIQDEIIFRDDRRGLASSGTAESVTTASAAVLNTEDKADLSLVEARRQKRLMKKALRAQGGNATATVMLETAGPIPKDGPKLTNAKDSTKSAKSTEIDTEKDKEKHHGEINLRIKEVPQKSVPVATSPTAAAPLQQIASSVRKIGQVPQQAVAPMKIEDPKGATAAASVANHAKAKGSILSKPDLIPGVLRSVPVSTALSISAPSPAMTSSESKSPHASLSAKIVEKVLGIATTEGNPMSFLQQNDQVIEPTPKPIVSLLAIEKTPTQNERLKGSLDKAKSDTSNDIAVDRKSGQEKDKDVPLLKDQRLSGWSDQKYTPSPPPTSLVKLEKTRSGKSEPQINGVSDVQKDIKIEDKSTVTESSRQQEETTKILATILDQHALEKAHIEKMKEINYNCELKNGDEREECEKSEREKRHEVEVEEKENKEFKLKKKYEVKDELLGKLAKDMKQEYKIRDALADRKEEHEESEAETLFVVFMLLLMLLLILLSLCGFNMCSCVFRQCGNCVRFLKNLCSRMISKTDRNRSGGDE